MFDPVNMWMIGPMSWGPRGSQRSQAKDQAQCFPSLACRGVCEWAWITHGALGNSVIWSPRETILVSIFHDWAEDRMSIFGNFVAQISPVHWCSASPVPLLPASRPLAADLLISLNSWSMLASAASGSHQPLATLALLGPRPWHQ